MLFFSYIKIWYAQTQFVRTYISERHHVKQIKNAAVCYNNLVKDRFTTINYH